MEEEIKDLKNEALEKVNKKFTTSKICSVCGTFNPEDEHDCKPALSFSKYCVRCYPDYKRAVFTKDGDSICEDCMERDRLMIK